MAAVDIQALTRALIGGMDLAVFNRDVREMRVMKYAAAIDGGLIERQFGIAKLEELLRRDAIPALSIDLFDGGQLRRFVDVQNKSGKSGLAVIVDHLRKGATLRVRDLDKFDAETGRFAREIRRYFAAPSQINVYLTPPGKAGFAPHFDTTDAFILQCAGSKEWRIYPEYSNRKELPLMETAWDPERFRPSGPAESFTLCAGDVLYLPRGAMHEAFCAQSESMHLTISIVSLTFADLIGKALRAAAESDVALRRRVAWSVEGDSGEAGEISVRVQEMVRGLAGRIDVGDLLRAERELLQIASDGDAADGLKSALRGLVDKGAS